MRDTYLQLSGGMHEVEVCRYLHKTLSCLYAKQNPSKNTCNDRTSLDKCRPALTGRCRRRAQRVGNWCLQCVHRLCVASTRGLPRLTAEVSVSAQGSTAIPFPLVPVSNHPFEKGRLSVALKVEALAVAVGVTTEAEADCVWCCE
jgi:hypothetical protein